MKLLLWFICQDWIISSNKCVILKDEDRIIKQVCYSKGRTVTEFDKICLYTFTIQGIVLFNVVC